MDKEESFYWNRLFRRFNFLPDMDCPDCGSGEMYMGMLLMDEEATYACKACNSVYVEVDGELGKIGVYHLSIEEDRENDA